MGGGNDTVTGKRRHNVINGGRGNDNLTARRATTRCWAGRRRHAERRRWQRHIRSDGDGGLYRGDAGNDTMFSGLGPETMDGGIGIDLIDHTAFNGNYVFNMATGVTNIRQDEELRQTSRTPRWAGRCNVQPSTGNALHQQRDQGGAGKRQPQRRLAGNEHAAGLGPRPTGPRC
jgi:Ca2+-binding RTX toxin-like protein